MKFAVAILALVLTASTVSAWVFAIDDTDTEESIRAQVLAGARLHLGGESITIENVTAFLKPIDAALRRVEMRTAGEVSRYAAPGSEPVGFLGTTDALALARSFRLVYLAGVARAEVAAVLTRVVSGYDERLTEVSLLAADLATTLTEIDSIQSSVLSIATSALENVSAAQDAGEALIGVLATYRTIIETQRELLIDGIGLTPYAGTSAGISLLAGPVWYYGPDESLASFSGAAGAIVSFPVFRSLRIGVGALTSFPPSSSIVLLQIGFSR
ncbi:MAG: hypothetical protein EA426_15170 [Spirochaetaceae bacterium]|nr:MAG: hypothetical protein EA426_15170 [Spirochaetaceae bacterium]